MIADSPIGSFFVYDFSVPINFESYNHKQINIHANIFEDARLNTDKDDISQSSLYNYACTSEGESTQVFNTSTGSSLTFQMSGYYEYLKMYNKTELVLSPTQRNLFSETKQIGRTQDDSVQEPTIETTEKYLIDSESYQVFYFMAQLGGLYSFLKLVFGVILNYVAHQSLMQTLINRVYTYTAEKQIEKEQDDRRSKFEDSKQSKIILKK